MSLANSSSYITKDPNWVGKMFKGGLFSMLPLVSAIANGYQIQTIRNLLAGEPRPLPEWRGIGRFWSDGIKVTVAKYMLTVPSLIAGGVIAVIDVVKAYSWLAPFFTNQTGTEVEIKALAGLLVVVLFHAIYGFFLAIVLLTLPVMVLRCAQNCSFLSLFNVFSHARFIFSHFGMYVATYLLSFILDDRVLSRLSLSWSRYPDVFCLCHRQVLAPIDLGASSRRSWLRR